MSTCVFKYRKRMLEKTYIRTERVLNESVLPGVVKSK